MASTSDIDDPQSTIHVTVPTDLVVALWHTLQTIALVITSSWWTIAVFAFTVILAILVGYYTWQTCRRYWVYLRHKALIDTHERRKKTKYA